MSAFVLDNLEEQLDQLEENGISVVDKQYTWNTADDGKIALGGGCLLLKSALIPARFAGCLCSM